MSSHLSPTIAVIIPVYNVEPYLPSCLESVVLQTLLPYEVILVDDGSTDRCGEICDVYKAKFPNLFTVIHKENGGLSDARNVGIEKCNADYILLLDSDDTLIPEACERITELLCETRPNILLCCMVTIFPDRRIYKKHFHHDPQKMMKGSEYLKNEIAHETMYYESQQGVYAREYLARENLRFEKGLLHEDQIFTTKALLHAERVTVAELFFYNHLMREESICTQKNQLPNARSIVVICRLLQEEAGKLSDHTLSEMICDHSMDLFFKAYIDADLYHHPDVRVPKESMRANSYSLKNKFRTSLFLFSEPMFYYCEKKRRQWKA